MKLSGLIEKLQAAHAQQGDLDVVIERPTDYGDDSELFPIGSVQMVRHNHYKNAPPDGEPRVFLSWHPTPSECPGIDYGLFQVL